jgi:hypothetical protein
LDRIAILLTAHRNIKIERAIRPPATVRNESGNQIPRPITIISTSQPVAAVASSNASSKIDQIDVDNTDHLETPVSRACDGRMSSSSDA